MTVQPRPDGAGFVAVCEVPEAPQPEEEPRPLLTGAPPGHISQTRPVCFDPELEVRVVRMLDPPQARLKFRAQAQELSTSEAVAPEQEPVRVPGHEQLRARPPLPPLPGP
jgi:hypothetical protein